MATKNESSLDDFFLLGFSKGLIICSLIIAVTYAIIVTGNIAVFIIIRVDSHLQTPMYFFLSCLSSLDVCYASVTLPMMVANALTGNSKISFSSCFMQMYFFVSFGGAESLLLASMAYDRYVAICNPFRYILIMNKEFCSCLVAGCWFLGFGNAMLHTLMTLKLTFCRERRINHYFCDVIPMLEAACSNTQSSQVVLHVDTVLLGLTTFLIVIISYVRIISAILKIQSSAGRRKVFSTCSAHLIVVIIFFITGSFSYNSLKSGDSIDEIRVSSIVYSVFPPLLNPVIYCLRNKEVKMAFRKAFVKS
ncbi:olfactory receptor 5V1-like [Aquarana catesbeiana]|uniref:olfactory receptor 5V1-like n=1 Tax=Aquarana catesbeiana TaxID=8400 RepID=UPI003CC96F30